MTEEEEFFAWLDGELAADDAARVEARVAADPRLRAEAEAHRAMTAGLRQAFDPVMTPRSEVVDFASERAVRGPRRPAALPQWAAVAATLVIGVGLGSMISGRGDDGSPIALEGGRIVAASALDQALTRQLASSDQQGAATRIGVTFRNEQGRLCRTFSATSATGLACRDREDWRIIDIYDAGGSNAGDYRMAAGSDPRLGARVDGMIVGQPLDAAGEAAAQQSGWK